MRSRSLILLVLLIQREFPVCEDGGESKVLRSRTSPARNQLRTPSVKAGESIYTLRLYRDVSRFPIVNPLPTPYERTAPLVVVRPLSF